MSTQDVFDHGGGQFGTLNIFLKLVTYQPTLSKFRGGPVKKKHPVVQLYARLVTAAASCSIFSKYLSNSLQTREIDCQRREKGFLRRWREPSTELAGC